MKQILIVLTFFAIAIFSCLQPKTYAQQAAITAYRHSGLDFVWRAQVPSAQFNDRPPIISLYVSPSQTRTVYEVLDGVERTLFAGPDAEHQSDIRHRVLLMSGREKTSIETRSVPVVSMLAQTFTGRVELIDAETGVRRWSVGLGIESDAEFPAAMDDNFAVATTGTQLYLIDAQTGKLIHERSLTSAPGGGPTIWNSHAYVPSMQGAFKVYSLEKESRDLGPKNMTSFGRVTSQPIMSAVGIIWTTNRGSVFLADPDSAATRFHLVGRSQVVGQPAVLTAVNQEEKERSDRVFVAYENGYLVSADADTGDTLWAFLADATLATGPLVADDLVVVATVDGRLFAIDAESGIERWSAAGIARAGGNAEGLIFCESMDGDLLMLDSQTGMRRGGLVLEPGEHLVENRVSDRVYITSASGGIRCFRKSGAMWPTIHTPRATTSDSMKPATTSESVKPGKTGSATTSPSESEVEAQAEVTSRDIEPAQPESDPFGQGDDDPFAAGDDPFAAGEDPQ